MVRFKESQPFMCPDFLLLRFEVVIVNMAEIVPLIFFTAMFYHGIPGFFLPIRSTGLPSSK